MMTVDTTSGADLVLVTPRPGVGLVSGLWADLARVGEPQPRQPRLAPRAGGEQGAHCNRLAPLNFLLETHHPVC